MSQHRSVYRHQKNNTRSISWISLMQGHTSWMQVSALEKSTALKN